MSRHQVLQPHGTIKRYRQGKCLPDGSRCDECKRANAEYQRDFKLGMNPAVASNVSPIRGRRASAQSKAQRAQEKSGPAPLVRPDPVGQVEKAVKEQLRDFATEHPIQVEMALVGARILDSPERVALHPTTMRQVSQIVDSLTAGKKKKARGRLAAVQDMTNNSRRRNA